MLLFAEFEQAHPGRGVVRRFSEFTGIGENYLSQLRARNNGIGAQVAKILEEAFGKPPGWMDATRAEWEPLDDAEQMYAEAMMLLYREWPAAARAQLLRQMRELLAQLRNRKDAVP